MQESLFVDYILNAPSGNIFNGRTRTPPPKKEHMEFKPVLHFKYRFRQKLIFIKKKKAYKDQGCMNEAGFPLAKGTATQVTWDS